MRTRQYSAQYNHALTAGEPDPDFPNLKLTGSMAILARFSTGGVFSSQTLRQDEQEGYPWAIVVCGKSPMPYSGHCVSSHSLIYMG